MTYWWHTVDRGKWLNLANADTYTHTHKHTHTHIKRRKTRNLQEALTILIQLLNAKNVTATGEVKKARTNTICSCCSLNFELNILQICTYNVFKFLFLINQFHPDSAWKQSSKTCMKLTIAECTVENS
jgi:hypothetical protein